LWRCQLTARASTGALPTSWHWMIRAAPLFVACLKFLLLLLADQS